MKRNLGFETEFPVSTSIKKLGLKYVTPQVEEKRYNYIKQQYTSIILVLIPQKCIIKHHKKFKKKS